MTAAVERNTDLQSVPSLQELHQRKAGTPTCGFSHHPHVSTLVFSLSLSRQLNDRHFLFISTFCFSLSLNCHPEALLEKFTTACFAFRAAQQAPTKWAPNAFPVAQLTSQPRAWKRRCGRWGLGTRRSAAATTRTRMGTATPRRRSGRRSSSRESELLSTGHSFAWERRTGELYRHFSKIPEVRECLESQRRSRSDV